MRSRKKVPSLPLTIDLFSHECTCTLITTLHDDLMHTLYYRLHATSSAGAVAGMVEEEKVWKYSCLAPTHTIMPVAVETLGVVGPRSLPFLKELAARMKQQSGEERAFQYLL